MRSHHFLTVVCAMALLLGACSEADSSTSETSRAQETTTTTTAPSEDLIGDDEFRSQCVNVEGEAALRVVEPACAYLASILSHDGSKVPVAPNAWRIEQGVNTGMSGPEIQESMSNDYFTTYVEGLRDIRRFVSGNEAIAYYVLDIREAPGIESTMLAERFKVEDGLITEIEVVFAYCRVPVSNATAPDGTDMCPKDASPPPPVA
ncbi:MAG: hypothetical protein IPG97_06340 [Microthrixaceae bacterium]|jgi:hypothetical protein|nr:hypothetical protein [Microthrixaceae bacterium]